jgi:hypothetical protein
VQVQKAQLRRQALLLEKREDDGFDAPSGVRDGERRRQAGWAANAALGGSVEKRIAEAAVIASSPSKKGP